MSYFDQVSVSSLPALAVGSNLIGKVEVWDGSAILFTSGNPGYIQGTVAATVSGSVSAIVTNAGIFAVQATQSGTWTVDIAASQTIAVTNAGIFAVQDSTAEGYLSTLAATFTAGNPGYIQGTVSIGSGPFAITGNITEWATTSLGAPTAFGTEPSGNVIGVNAEVFQGSSVVGSGNPLYVQFDSAQAVTGSFYQATQPVSIASGEVASGAFASGSIASGAISAGAAAAGAFADGSVYVRSNAASTFPVTATQGPAASSTAPWYASPGIPTTGSTLRTNASTSSSGWTSIIAAGGGSETVRLWRLVVSASAATNIEIGDGTNVFLGPYYLTADGSITLDFSGEPWCITGPNAALEINNSASAVAITFTTWTTQS